MGPINCRPLDLKCVLDVTSIRGKVLLAQKPDGSMSSKGIYVIRSPLALEEHTVIVSGRVLIGMDAVYNLSTHYFTRPLHGRASGPTAAADHFPAIFNC